MGRPPESIDRSTPFWILVFLGCLALTWISFHPVLDYGFTDMDSLMNVAEARVDGPADLYAQLTKKLTGGRAGGAANFYRPVTMAVNAVLRRAFGWNPRGYHAFDLLLHAANGLLLTAFATGFARQVGLDRPLALGLLTGGLFLVHPVAIENVPAPARMADLLVTAFAFAALLVLGRAETRRRDGGPVGALAGGLVLYWLLFAACLGTKEPGVVLAGAGALYAFLLRDDLELPPRLLHAAGTAAVCGVVLAGFIALRARVLGELVGGYGEETSLFYNLDLVVRAMSVDLVFPGYAWWIKRAWPPFQIGSLAWASLGLAGLALLGLGWGAYYRLRSGAWRGARDAGRVLRADLHRLARNPSARIAGFAAAVVLAYAALFVLSKFYDRRITYTAVAFFCLLPALAIHAAMAGSAPGAGRVARVARRAARVVLTFATAAFLWQSALVHEDIEWPDAGETARLLTEGLREQWAALPPGSRVYVANLPYGFSLDPQRERMHGPESGSFGPNWPGIQAWLDDQLPDRHLEVLPLDRLRWTEGLADFHHEARVQDGWLRYRRPRRIDPVPLGGEGSPFRVRQLGPDRVALARRAPFERPTWVLVFDGHEPRLFDARRLTGDPSDDS